MPRKIVNSLTSILAGTLLLASSIDVQAGGMSHMGNWGGGHSGWNSGPNCGSGGGFGGGGWGRTTINNNNLTINKPVTVNNNVNVYKPTTIDTNINVYKPVTVNKDINITNNIDNSKSIDIYKPVSIQNNIDASKTITIDKSIDNSKYIDASKNISIDKSVVINKGGSSADAAAIAIAIAEASANASVTANFYGSGGGGAVSTVYVGGGGVAEAGAMGGGDIGTLSVVSAPAAPQQCTYEDATVVKAIHAVCVSADGHEFPASHMTGDTWISASYEGEVARCIPGSHLKVVVGQVTQSNQGLASGYSSGQVLTCGPHEALRHFKDGMLKCAPAVPVPDCTERTNLRKYGSGDLFFTYRTKVCLETHQEYSQSTAP